MEEGVASSETPKKGMNKVVIAVIVVLVIVALAVGFILLKPKQAVAPANNTSPTPTSMEAQESPTATPSVSISPSGTMTKGQEINVSGQNYKFSPSAITVKKGEAVTINFTAKDMVHDFIIDELNVKSQRVTSGNSTTVTFTPAKTGTYTFYCSVGNHRSMGMEGRLIVQ